MTLSRIDPMHDAAHGHALADKVGALLDPATYPRAPGVVEAVETHMSWVFMAGERVYKLKKPVRSADQDFSTLARRRHFCQEEVRLNRRLAPWVYLGVVPLVEDHDGRLCLDAPGTAVDWLVEMRRLPAEDLLDRRLAAGDVHPDDMDRVARRLADFHRAQQRAPHDGVSYRARLWRVLLECERNLLDPTSPLPRRRVAVLLAGLRDWLVRGRELLDARLQAGHVVEGHGDLRAEHVWLGEPLAVIDCLEFSRELRWLDVADDVGLLALECERAGAGDLADVLLERYASYAADHPPVALSHFYRALRACVRAGLAAAHLREPRYRDQPKWALQARCYGELAIRHLRLARLAAGPAAGSPRRVGVHGPVRHAAVPGRPAAQA